jgi:hypothetical protein
MRSCTARSIHGLYPPPAQLFASGHPREVAGVVLVDRPFPDVALVALRHGISFDAGGEPDPRVERLWGALQRANAARSPRGRVVLAPRSHHRIGEDQPELVIAAVREVLSG